MDARRKAMAGVLTAMILAGAGCAGTKLKDQWRDPDYRAAAAQRVLVIGVIGNDQRRRIFEDEFVGRLRQAGVEAAASYPQLPVSGPEDLTAVRRVVERSGATLVLSVRMADVTRETRVSGDYYASSGFYSYYPSAWRGIYYPPEVYTHRTYVTETRVFDIKRDAMAWAATLQTDEPSDFSAAAAQYADLVVKQMQYNKIIGER